MKSRSRAREVALQLLFQHDANPHVPRSAIEQFVRDRLRDPEAEEFCLSLYDGVLAQRRTLDADLGRTAENWRVARMTSVDRNVMRLSLFEMAHREPATPVAVALNEAIELARRYGSADSPSFVNGILDRLAPKGTEQEENADPAS
jgi:N utilization substance protein B